LRARRRHKNLFRGTDFRDNGEKRGLKKHVNAVTRMSEM
jgi:hypothetical protein